MAEDYLRVAIGTLQSCRIPQAVFEIVPNPLPFLFRPVSFGLTGFMGAGKSTIGQLLAKRTGWEFLDLDTHIEVTTGKSAKELFANLGESGFDNSSLKFWQWHCSDQGSFLRLVVQSSTGRRINML
ncbi:MAG: shikimate kinase [Acidobacteriaceae bacterium]